MHSFRNPQKIIREKTEKINNDFILYIDDYIIRAKAYLQVGNKDAALADANIAIKNVSHFDRIDCFRVYALRAVIFYERRNYKKAIEDSKHALKYLKNINVHHPAFFREVAQAFHLLGKAYEEIGNKPLAISAYIQSLKNGGQLFCSLPKKSLKQVLSTLNKKDDLSNLSEEDLINCIRQMSPVLRRKYFIQCLRPGNPFGDAVLKLGCTEAILNCLKKYDPTFVAPDLLAPTFFNHQLKVKNKINPFQNTKEKDRDEEYNHGFCL